MTPEQHASQDLFGRSDYVPCDRDHAFPWPQKPDRRVSYNELVALYRASIPEQMS